MWSILHASWLEPRPHYAEEILFLRLGLQFTLICHKNGAFQKRSSNRRNLKTVAFRFSVDGKHLKYVTFRKRSLNLRNLKALAFCFSVDGKHLKYVTFRKRSVNLRNLKALAFCFSVDEKHFKNGAFIKRWHHDNGVISLPEFSSNRNLKWLKIKWTRISLNENEHMAARNNLIL